MGCHGISGRSTVVRAGRGRRSRVGPRVPLYPGPRGEDIPAVQAHHQKPVADIYDRPPLTPPRSTPPSTPATGRKSQPVEY